MKKTVKILALMLVLVMALGVLASCGRLSGTYVSATGSTYEFSGDEFVLTSGKSVFEGTYRVEEIDSDLYIFFVVEKMSYDGKVMEIKDPANVLGTDKGVDFFENEEEGWIRIDTTEYYLQED